MFFEDNVMTNPNTSNLALTDGNGGTRIVVRRNTITNMSVQGHGTAARVEPGAYAQPRYTKTP